MVEDRENLVRDISAVLNMHSVDNQANTPDFILAELVVKHLEGICAMIETRMMHSQSEVGREVERLWNNPDEVLKILDPLTDSNGEEPPYPPEPGFRWELDHTVCDQGHYGSSSWKQTKDDTLKYAAMLGSRGHREEVWIIYEKDRGYIAGEMATMPAGSQKLEKEAMRVLEAMNA